MGDGPPADYRVSEITDRRQLARCWQQLEAQASASFFQSWTWVGCWLECLPDTIRPLGICVSGNDEPLALAVVNRQRRRRHRVLNSIGLFVGEVGDHHYDALTLEYGGPLAKPLAAHAALQKLGEHLLGDSGWDELYLSGIDQAAADCYRRYAEQHQLRSRIVDCKPTFFVDLAALRGGTNDYLTTLSRNTRYQIRRAMRAYQTGAGPIALTAARSVDEAQQFLNRLIDLHQNYWRAKGRAGAFGSDFQCHFHRRLVELAYPQQQVQLLKITAGSDEIGYLYNFVRDKTVYCYQSGFCYPDDARLKPGLVSHTLAVEHNTEVGLDRYDFLAGEARYKRSLSSHQDQMLWLVLQRRRLKFTLEDAARGVRNRLQRSRQHV